MAVKVDVDDIIKIKDELLKLGNKADGIVDDALYEGAKILHDEAEKTAHKSKLNKKHMRENIPIDKEKPDGSIHSVNIGWEKEENKEFFYAKYQEWGSSKMKARPFLQPAIDKKSKKAEQVILDKIYKELGL